MAVVNSIPVEVHRFVRFFPSSVLCSCSHCVSLYSTIVGNLLQWFWALLSVTFTIWWACLVDWKMMAMAFDYSPFSPVFFFILFTQFSHASPASTDGKQILILNWTTISKIGILISFRYNAENSLQFVVYFLFLATHKILCFSPTILYAQHTIE